MVFFQMTHSCQSNVLNCCTLEIFFALHIVLLARQTTVCIYAWVAFSNRISCHFQCISPKCYKFERCFLNVRLKGVNFCGVLFCAFFILRELIFADRGQSAKSAKIRTRKIFMLHGRPNSRRAFFFFFFFFFFMVLRNSF